MSINCDLIEVPEDLLNLFRVNRQAMYLYYKAAYSRNEPNIHTFKKIPRKQQHLVKEICQLYPQEYDRIKQLWNLANCQSVLGFKTNHSDNYFAIKRLIPKIIEFGKNSKHLELGRCWHLFNYIFSVTTEMQATKLVEWDRPNLGIHPICYQAHPLNLGIIERNYLTVAEVKTLSELMEEFGKDIVTENMKLICDRHKAIYSLHQDNFNDESWVTWAKEWCNGIQDFYRQVAENQNAVIIQIS